MLSLVLVVANVAISLLLARELKRARRIRRALERQTADIDQALGEVLGEARGIRDAARELVTAIAEEQPARTARPPDPITVH